MVVLRRQHERCRAVILFCTSVGFGCDESLHDLQMTLICRKHERGALAASRAFTTGKLLLNEAYISAVPPLNHTSSKPSARIVVLSAPTTDFAFTSALASSRACTISRFPLCEATISAVSPIYEEPRALTSTPAAIRDLTFVRSFVRTARKSSTLSGVTGLAPDARPSVSIAHPIATSTIRLIASTAFLPLVIPSRLECLGLCSSSSRCGLVGDRREAKFADWFHANSCFRGRTRISGKMGAG